MKARLPRLALTVELSMAIQTALDTCAGPALDGALAGIAEAFGLPEREIRKLAGVDMCEVHGKATTDDCPHYFSPE